MGMAIFSPTVSRPPMLALLLAPLQDLLALFSSSRYLQNKSRHSIVGTTAIKSLACTRATRAMDTAPWRAARSDAIKTFSDGTEQNISLAAKPSRLRVVRAFDPGVAPSYAGRMVISGRMADVCAELDRMTQKEASRLQH